MEFCCKMYFLSGPGVSTSVSFTGKANLIVRTLDDFFIATQASRHVAQATGVNQTVGFSFKSPTLEAVLLSSTTGSNSLRVFWVGQYNIDGAHSYVMFLPS